MLFLFVTVSFNETLLVIVIVIVLFPVTVIVIVTVLYTVTVIVISIIVLTVIVENDKSRKSCFRHIRRHRNFTGELIASLSSFCLLISEIRQF